jgi:hypothetical protein
MSQTAYFYLYEIRWIALSEYLYRDVDGVCVMHWSKPRSKLESRGNERASPGEKSNDPAHP